MIPGQPDLHRSPRLVASRSGVPVVTEIDFDRLRRGRLERLQAAMRRHGMEVALLYNFSNIRYATGTDLMAVWTGSTLERYAVVPAEGADFGVKLEDQVLITREGCERLCFFPYDEKLL